MQTITQKQYESLTSSIYSLLMQDPTMNMGEMIECEGAAINLVANWMEENNIEVKD